MLTRSTVNMKQREKTGSHAMDSQSLHLVMYFLERSWTSSSNRTTNWGESFGIHELMEPFSFKPSQTSKTNSKSLVFRASEMLSAPVLWTSSITPYWAH